MFIRTLVLMLILTNIVVCGVEVGSALYIGSVGVEICHILPHPGQNHASLVVWLLYLSSAVVLIIATKIVPNLFPLRKDDPLSHWLLRWLRISRASSVLPLIALCYPPCIVALLIDGDVFGGANCPMWSPVPTIPDSPD